MKSSDIGKLEAKQTSEADGSCHHLFYKKDVSTIAHDIITKKFSGIVDNEHTRKIVANDPESNETPPKTVDTGKEVVVRHYYVAATKVLMSYIESFETTVSSPDLELLGDIGSALSDAYSTSSH